MRRYVSVVGDLSSQVGRNVSRRERDDTLQASDPSLRYGELGFKAVASILGGLRDHHGLPSEGGVFFDLGAGMGKAVIAAALCHRFDKAIGLELLEGLHVLSLELKRRYDEGATSNVVVEMRRGDALAADLAPANVVMVHGACFVDKLWSRLAQHLATTLAAQTFVVTVSLELPAADFDRLETRIEALDDGDALVFVYKRR